MEEATEEIPTLKLGTVTLSDREGRRTNWNTQLTLRCDAAAVLQGKKTLLLLSCVGSESSCKALMAKLRSDTKVEITIKDLEYLDGTTLKVRTFDQWNVEKDDAGYNVVRHKLDYGLWHLLITTKAEGFIPALSPEALWQQLRSDRYTTPILKSWLPWMLEQLEEGPANKAMATIYQAGCNCGLMNMSSAWFDQFITHGIQKGHISIKDEQHGI